MVKEGSEQIMDLSETNSMGESPSSSGVIQQEDLELKRVLESTFGPGAYDSISDLLLDDPNFAASALDLESEEIPGELTTRQLNCEPPVTQENQTDAAISEDQGAVSNQNISKGLTTAESTLLVFELAGREFAVAITNVIEIRQLPSVTSIRRGPAWLLGLANLRGNVIPIVSLQHLLGLSPDGAVNSGHMIVIRTTNSPSPTGVIVDRVSGLGATTELATTENVEDGVFGWIERNDTWVAVLDLERLLKMNDVRLESA